MPEIKLTEVTAVSFQDKKYPADNIISGTKSGKWLCPMPRTTNVMEATFRLEQQSKINAIHIGNCGSAFITILVSKRGSAEFHTLLPSSTLMNPSQSKGGTNRTCVKLFTSEHFCDDVKSEKWDVIMLKCNQPFETHSAFGVSFIHVFSYSNEVPMTPVLHEDNGFHKLRQMNHPIKSSPRDIFKDITSASPRSKELVSRAQHMYGSTLNGTPESDNERDPLTSSNNALKTKAVVEINGSEYRNNIKRFYSRSPKMICKSPLAEKRIHDDTKPIFAAEDSEDSQPVKKCRPYNVQYKEPDQSENNCDSSVENDAVPGPSETMPCPICGRLFGKYTIEFHASICAQERFDEQSLIGSSNPGPSSTVHNLANNDNQNNLNKMEKSHIPDLEYKVLTWLKGFKMEAQEVQNIKIGELRKDFEKCTDLQFETPDKVSFVKIVTEYIASMSSKGKGSGNKNKCKSSAKRKSQDNLKNGKENTPSHAQSNPFTTNKSPVDNSSTGNALHNKCSPTAYHPGRPRKLFEEINHKEASVQANTRVDSDSEDATKDLPLMVECPICNEFFESFEIEAHSSTCGFSKEEAHDDDDDSDLVVCPICQQEFNSDSISLHADSCAQARFHR